MSAECNNAPLCPLAAYVRSRHALQLHTGNIIKWPELKTKGFTNGAEELAECMRLQLGRLKPPAGDNSGGPPTANVIELCERGECAASLAEHKRADLKITLKIFLAELAGAEARVDQAFDAVLEQLKVHSVDYLIVALPEFDATQTDAADASEVSEWLERVKPLWRHVESLVAGGERAVAAGLADLEADELRALHAWAERVKPSIDHYSIEGCCTVPDELRQFARSNDILLLTHNDPRDFPGSGRLLAIGDVEPTLRQCCQSLAQWRTAFVARYTVMIRSRSIVASKGYIVRFEKKTD